MRVDINGFHMMELASHGKSIIEDYSRIHNNASIRNACIVRCNIWRMSIICAMKMEVKKYSFGFSWVVEESLN